jgi:hypothetical protein
LTDRLDFINRRTDARTKHIDVKYHFVRQMMEMNAIQIVRTSTETMIADTLTKPTSIRKFEWCREQMGIKSIPRDIGLRGRVEDQTECVESQSTIVHNCIPSAKLNAPRVTSYLDKLPMI